MSRSVLKLRVNPEYQALVHPLSKEDFIQPKQSLSDNGQFLDIIVNESGVILDGHTRYKILNELGIQPKVSIKKFSNNLLECSFVIQSNLARRHLNNFQRIELALKLKPILQEIAKKNQRAGKPLTNIGERSRQGVNGIISKNAKAGHETVRKVEYILKNPGKDDIERLNSGQKTISKIYRKVMKEEKRREFMKAKPLMELPDGVRLMCGDFREKCMDIKSNSIDLLFSIMIINNI